MPAPVMVHIYAHSKSVAVAISSTMTSCMSIKLASGVITFQSDEIFARAKQHGCTGGAVP